MAVSLVAHTLSAGASSLTTSAINTTGANFLVVSLTYLTTNPPTFSDSKSNTWHTLTVQNDPGGDTNVILYAENATVGTGHTFSTSATGNVYNTVVIAAFGGLSSVPLENQTGATVTTSTTAQPGSLAATTTGDLIIVSYGNAGNANTTSINDSFTVTDQESYIAGVNFGGGLAYLVALNTSGVNPTWTSNNAVTWALSIATFAAASSGLIKSLSDTFTLTDIIKQSVAVKWAEVLILTDVVKRYIIIKYTEILTLVDKLMLSITVKWNEVLTLVDNFFNKLKSSFPVGYFRQYLNDLPQVQQPIDSFTPNYGTYIDPDIIYFRTYLGNI